jgi:hypothetical protein
MSGHQKIGAFVVVALIVGAGLVACTPRDETSAPSASTSAGEASPSTDGGASGLGAIAYETVLLGPGNPG